MAKWKTTEIVTDRSLVEEFRIYEANDVGMEKALRLTKEGKLIARSIEDAQGGSMVPVGAILMWSGDAKNIPEGWVLCDGQNGTPNLVARFIRGASATAEPKAGDQGGSDTHSHVAKGEVTIKQAGAHTHGMPAGWYSNTASSGKGVTIVDRRMGAVETAVTAREGDHTHETDTRVSIQEERSLPSWYALCFIMKRSE